MSVLSLSQRYSAQGVLGFETKETLAPRIIYVIRCRIHLQKFRASPKAVMEIKQQTSKKVAEAIAEMENKKNNSSSEMLWSPYKSRSVLSR